MKKLGVTMEDMGSATKKRATKGRRAATKGKAKSSVPPKYRDPATGATWTGRGRAPVWMAAKIATGSKKEDFLISAA